MTITNPKTVEMLQVLAAANICDGILYEPRVYYDLFDVFTGGVAQSDPDIFRNGEEYPVRITHVLTAMRRKMSEEGSLDDERLIQRYGMRIISHDNYYMNPIYVPMPLWHNVRSAASDVITKGQASWKFQKPIYMGARDTFEVRLAPEIVISGNVGTQRFGVCFNGVGALSRRPKQLAGYIDLAEADGVATQTISTDFYKNDGVEPLEIHEVVITVNGGSQASPAGDIRLGKFSIQQIGNGTNARWTVGPNGSDDLAPGSLWGISCGRAVIHELPKGNDGYPGWLWYPGMGLTIEVEDPLGLAAEYDQYVYVGLAGYAIIR